LFLVGLLGVADLPHSDDDSGGVQGLFLVTHETEGMVEWKIRDGGGHVLPGDERHQYLGPF
jgi:hypothetical protein